MVVRTREPATAVRRASARPQVLCAVALLVLALPAGAAAGSKELPFPRGFLWGTEQSGFQSEMGGRPANVDASTDWFRWTHDAANVTAGRVTRDRPERGPGAWARYRTDLDLARRRLHARVFRLSLEWSRIFPRSTAGVRVGGRITARELRRLDRLADPLAVRHYRAVLARIRDEGMAAFVTASHFSLPLWVHDPIAQRDALARLRPDDPLPRGLARAGWLDAATVGEFRKYAAYLGWRFGDLVDLWNPINEPLVVAINGYVNIGIFGGAFPPGALSFPAALRAVTNLERANAAAYDALHAADRRDADGDGVRARVGVVQNMIAFTPADPGSALDLAGQRHADYIFNRLFLDAAVRGVEDADADGVVDPGERDPRRAGKTDFIGVNYYLRGRVSGLAASISTAIPIVDFLPSVAYRTPQRPTAPPCPTTCSDFGSEIYPEGLRQVLAIAGGYRLPVYVTENGIADANDDQRPGYLLAHLRVLRQAILDRVADVRGYLYWSLTDNFEWAAGFAPKFGLYAFDPVTLRRTPRRSARLFGAIARHNAVPASP